MRIVAAPWHLTTFRLLVAGALPDATFDFSAPALWKRILRLAVLGEFIRYKTDFRGLAGNTIRDSAQRYNLAALSVGRTPTAPLVSYPPVSATEAKYINALLGTLPIPFDFEVVRI